MQEQGHRSVETALEVPSAARSTSSWPEAAHADG